MQTAAIPYRVADFLKQHPPFDLVSESDLVSLAARGRVKFHEVDEYICWQGSPHPPFVYVVQQGSVSLWDESVDPPRLRDILGAGDSVGLERFNGAAASLHSARAASDVVLYALPAADIGNLLERYPHVRTFVSSCPAVTAGFEGTGQRPRPDEIAVAGMVRSRPAPVCPASAPVREAARLLAESGETALALTGEGGCAGILTADDVMRWVGEGAVDPGQPACRIARGSAVSLPTTARVSDCVVAMAESGASAAAVTVEGDGSSPGWIVTPAALEPAFGDHPLSILREIAMARRTEVLAVLHDRARAWILDHLASPSSVDWLATYSDQVNRLILERAVDLAGQDGGGNLWCFYGAAGRRELLTRVAPELAVIGDGRGFPSVAAVLAECGYLAPASPVEGDLAEWKSRFSGWIRDPIRTRMYDSRPLFDLRPVCGGDAPFRELEDHVRSEIASEPAFLRILANDCLSSLPPLTFFRDAVIEESGRQTDRFRLEASAVDPLADVARVFGLACGGGLGGSTRARLDRARRLLPSQETVFRETAETAQVMLFHQARGGLRLGSSGAELPLSLLSRYDRHVLKSGFRSIHRLLAFAASWDWLEAV